MALPYHRGVWNMCSPIMYVYSSFLLIWKSAADMQQTKTLQKKLLKKANKNWTKKVSKDENKVRRYAEKAEEEYVSCYVKVKFEANLKCVQVPMHSVEICRSRPNILSQHNTHSMDMLQIMIYEGPFQHFLICSVQFDWILIKRKTTKQQVKHNSNFMCYMF